MTYSIVFNNSKKRDTDSCLNLYSHSVKSHMKGKQEENPKPTFLVKHYTVERNKLGAWALLTSASRRRLSEQMSDCLVNPASIPGATRVNRKIRESGKLGQGHNITQGVMANFDLAGFRIN